MNLVGNFLFLLAFLVCPQFSGCKNAESSLEPGSTNSSVVFGSGTDCIVETDSSIKSIYDTAKDPFRTKILTLPGCKSEMEKKNPYVIFDFLKKAGCEPKGRFLVSETSMVRVLPETGTDPRTVDEWKCGNAPSTLDEDEAIVNRVWISGPGSAMHIISWDQSSKSFNFYSADHPSPKSQIFFHGNLHTQAVSSDNSFRHPCTNCHVGGGLLLKELHFPWTFWHSDVHTLPGVAGPKKWVRGSSPVQIPIAVERFERSTISSLTMANQSFVNGMGQGKKFGSPLPQNEPAPQLYKDLLYPLFCDRGLEIASADFAGSAEVPWSLMLNRLLVPKNGQISLTAGIKLDSKGKTSRLDMTGNRDDTDYRELPKLIGNMSEAANFFAPPLADTLTKGQIPLIFPARLFADDDLVSRLVLEGIISEDFAINILTVDLQNPIFSATRCRLLEKIPSTKSVPENRGEWAAMGLEIAREFEKNIESDPNKGNPSSGASKYQAMKKITDKANFVMDYAKSCQKSFGDADSTPRAMAHRWKGYKRLPDGIGAPYVGKDFNRGIEDFVESAAIPTLKAEVPLQGITQNCLVK
jgi:hypothetical protein